MEELAGARILVNWLALADEGLSSREVGTVTVDEGPLAEALGQLVRPMGLHLLAVDATTLEVTSRKDAAARLELEFYPVADLVAGGTEPA